MADAETWLSSTEFANLAEISFQAARKALKSAHCGRPWRDALLRVRTRQGRGGQGGLHYEVAESSLPAGLKRPSLVPASPADPWEGFEGAGEAAPKQSDRISYRWSLIAGPLQHAFGSRDRAQAVVAAAAMSGRTERTLYNWIRRYESQGLRGLARAKHADAGRRRIYVSRCFDRSARLAGQDNQVLREVADAIEQSIKGLWASRAEHAGATEIRRLAEFLLLELCEAKSIHVDRRAIRLSRRYVERFANYRVINQRRNDRKAFDDAKPRIRRDWTALAPMERVVGDVKHLDIVVARPDGTTAWPKIVAFMDAGTGRVFVVPFLLDPGEGIRQEHVIEAFLTMATEPNWGFPQGLYLDNGAEFAVLTKIDGALQLLNAPAARTMIFARPYNASAKPIESLFARLDRYVFALIPGYAGPNRMAKKTQTVGKPPKPYPGSWEAFTSTVQGLITAHNNRPVGGQWRDRSPNDWAKEKAQAGWRPVKVELADLDAAFADHDSRRVDRGVIRLRGERFTHPALSALPSRTVVDLALPWRRGADPLAKMPQEGWVYLTREAPYPARWIEGAREAGRRQASQARYVAKLARDAPTIDPVATKLRWSRRVAEQGALSSELTIDLGQEIRDLGGAIAAGRDEAQQPTPQERRRAREMAITERLERIQENDT